MQFYDLSVEGYRTMLLIGLTCAIFVLLLKIIRDVPKQIFMNNELDITVLPFSLHD